MKKTTLASIIATVLSAQAVPGHTQVMEELVVTAQKREQNLQDVGVSVSAFSGDQMKALGVTNTVEITQQVPGLQVNTWSPTLTTFNLRGVSQNNFTDNLEAPVAVYSDDVYIGSMNAISGQLFDVERVEVLRGPQGTLFGRNATGGLIHYVSKDASEEDLNGYVELGLSDFNTTTLEGAVGGAISDTVRGRFSARWEEGDGYVEATIPGVRDLGGRDGYALRGTIQADLSDTVTADFTVKYTEDNDVATGGYVVFSGGGPEAIDPVTGLGIPDGTNVRPFEHDSEYQGRFDREASSYTAKFNWALGDSMEFVSITNYTDLDKFYTEDGDAFPILAVNFTTIAEYEQMSQEFRLSGETDRSRWQVGAYYLDMDIYSEAITAGIPGSIGACFGGLIAAPSSGDCLDYAPGGAGAPVEDTIPDGAANTQIANQTGTNWSLFGQYEYDFTDTTTVILGYRWSQDDKDIDFEATYADNVTRTEPVTVFNAAEALDAAGLPNNDEIDYGDFAARVQIDQRLGDETLLFVSYNRGIKGGNWSINADVTPDNFRHDEEVLNAYELGIKTDLGVARINATAFYYDYQDYQAFSLTGLVPQVENTDATVQGGEVEVIMTPSQNWDLLGGLSFIDSEVDEVIDANGGVVTNNELPNAPGISANWLARYNFDTSIGNLAFQIDGVYNDEQFLEVTNAEVSREDSYAVMNANVSLTTMDEALRVTAWVKNFTDEEYRIYNLDLGVLGATSFYAPPRWYGVTVNYSF
jgi:iron complex outermembrane receptor protein